jgi:hypothetical protein
MKKLVRSLTAFLSSKPVIITLAFVIGVASFIALAHAHPTFAQSSVNTNVEVSEGSLGFKIPDLAAILTFAIRLFFVLAGIAALFYGLWGAFSWVTSGGEQENLDKARQKIVAALVGVILVVVILAIIVTFEQFIFQGRVCFGLSCPVTIPGILEACVPNPQYGTPPAIYDRRVGNGLGDPVTNSPEVQCCPNDIDDEDKDVIRLTTGWADGSPNFGNNDYRICCIRGDFDGDQICDNL